MYLISWIEEESKLETSLGGRVTADEMKVVFEELQEIMADVEEQPYLMVLDYSRAKTFDVEADTILFDIKEFCIAKGAEKVVSVVRDIDEVVSMTSRSLQNVLEGMEDFVTDPAVIKWTPTVAVSDIVRKAA